MAANVATPATTYGTLVGSAVTTVQVPVVSGTPPIQNVTSVEVVNRSGAAEIFFTVDGNNPTVGGAGTYCLPATIGASLAVSAPFEQGGNIPVALISSGTPTFGVTGLPA